MKETKLGTYIRNDETYNFNFSTNLSTADKLKFVQSVVSLVVGDDNYNSIIRNLITDFYIINICSCFNNYIFIFYYITKSV